MRFRTLRTHLTLGTAVMLAAVSAQAAEFPQPQEGDWAVSDFRFHDGATLPELKLHYLTLGNPSGDPVLVLHGSSGSGRGMLSRLTRRILRRGPAARCQPFSTSSCRMRSAPGNRRSLPTGCA